jgi:leader peptidase (prepilin peptidase)/N-methyltransferase
MAVASQERILDFDMLHILGTIFAGLLGLSFGSLLNVCVLRWPRGESIVRPRSHCRGCGRTLAWWEILPVVSWLFLRGRCRTCHIPVSCRYPLIELAVGVPCAIAGWQWLGGLLAPDLPPLFYYSSMIVFFGKMILTWLLVALAVLDAENLWLPDWLTLPGAALGFIAYLLRYRVISESVLIAYGKFVLHERSLSLGALNRLLGILAAAALILLIRWVYWLIRRREGIGLGDAKLMAMLAAWLGLPGALLAFLLGFVLGTLFGVALLAIPAANKAGGSWALKKLPLGTFLCVGGMISSLWGQSIIAAYLRWAGL